jgi:hypothetical protein
MKKDKEVRIYMDQRAKGLSQQLAAARAGFSLKTARKYERTGKLPSQLDKPRSHRTRSNPFELDWGWVVAQLELDWALQVSTIFELLCQKRPGHYQAGQERTLRRHVALWRALHGPDQEVIFEQVHQPGLRSQSDFTNMNELAVTLAGQPFPHLFYHFVLTYSNVEAATLCKSETFEALAQGLEHALWQVGGVPKEHRTDHLSAAKKHLDSAGQQDFTQRYQALMAHYQLQPTLNNAGVSHENGDVEQSHYRFKQALDQALRVRGSRDFVDRASYESFVAELIRKRNLKRSVRFEVERKQLRPLPAVPLAPCRQLEVRVSRFSTIAVLGNLYSVPSRLIGFNLRVRVWAEKLECFAGPQLVASLPRQIGKRQHLINYRHIIWSLVRKPAAFAEYRWREELFPSLAFRAAYDQLVSNQPKNCDQHYLRLLYLAATAGESEVETALSLLAETGIVPTSERVSELVRLPSERVKLPQVKLVSPDLKVYDQLIPSLASASASGGVAAVVEVAG